MHLRDLYQGRRLNLRESDLHWLAGLLEGEASFLFGAPSKRNAVAVTLQMTDRDVVERAAALMGNPKVSKRKRQKPHHKDTWRFAVKGVPAVELMTLLLPLMGKRRSARIRAVLASHDPNKKALQRKLTDKQVREARARFGNGENGKALAKEYGMFFTGFYRMLRSETYTHVTGE